ncbi:hypothetical protein GCM10029964_109370 [Kibdelosporangium lantanae]
MRRFNWTIVAISAGVSLGAGVALLSTGGEVPRGSGLIVPQSMPVDTQGTPAKGPDSFIPTVIDVVPVTAVGYTEPVETPPPPSSSRWWPPNRSPPRSRRRRSRPGW